MKYKDFIKYGIKDGQQYYKLKNAKNHKKYWFESELKELGLIKKTVMIIGDTHIPFVHPNYLKFCCNVRDKYNPDIIVHIGDLIDNHAISYHEHDPDGYSAGGEIIKARKELKKWIKEFPKMLICRGNHDILPARKAKTMGIPRVMLKEHNEIWDLPDTWEWQEYFEIDDVRYVHGSGKAGKYMHVLWAQENRQSTVSGHGHSSAGVEYMASHNSLIFGMGVGCGIDIKKYAFEYGKDYARRPILGCGIVEKGINAKFIPMKLGG